MVTSPHGACLPRYRSTDKVQWPKQFVASDCRLLQGGVLDMGEVPFGSGPCMICGANFSPLITPPSDAAELPIPHVMEPRHRQRLQHLRHVYTCYWQDFLTPDGRPYYYDHVSNTWSFARPKQRIVEAETIEAEEPVCGAEEKELRERLQKVLRPFVGNTLVEATSDLEGIEERDTNVAVAARTHACNYCGRIFVDAWSREQHLNSMAGRKGHPPDPAAACRDPSVALATSGNAWAVGVPGQAVTAPRYLSAEKNIERAEKDGQVYWFNPTTRACAWTRKDLIQLNREFYKGVIYSQAARGQFGSEGQTSCWTKTLPTGEKLTAWTLVELYSKCQRTAGEPLD